MRGVGYQAIGEGRIEISFVHQNSTRAVEWRSVTSFCDIE